MKKRYLIVILFCLIVSAIYFFNKKEEPIKIGFIGALTGKYSVLGNAMLNGVILAFEEIDYEIDGRKVEIQFEDDKQNPDLNKQIINGFINNNVKIVIGNVTSTMSKISMSLINKQDDMFMISASSASNSFSGKDDNFFRVHSANNEERFDSFTDYIINKGYKKVYGIYDPFNEAYAKDYLINFEASLISKGHEGLIFYEKTNTKLDLLVSHIKQQKPDLILLCANSVDSARIIQYLRLNNIQTKVASSEWARTPSFIENAGKASEGVIFNIDYNEKAQNKEYIDFLKRYEKKHGKKPSLYASKAYELSKIIIEMLKVGPETKIKENLLKQREFEGLQGKIVFDKYGDVIREYYNFEVKNGEFIKIDE